MQQMPDQKKPSKKRVSKMADIEIAKVWNAGDRELTHRGYAIKKDILSVKETSTICNALTVKPVLPSNYASSAVSFPVYYESPSRWYVPRYWGERSFGKVKPEDDLRVRGDTLREDLPFTGDLRGEQIGIVDDFINKGANGLVCVPCGYGKTFMAIKIASILKRRFIVVVHKEFLLSQWRSELESRMPGVRIGILQGSRTEIGPEYDCTIAMLQTLCLHEFPSSTFKQFGLSIFDECHHLGAEHFSKALMKVQTYHMLGLSATPKRNDGLQKVFSWYIGPIVAQIKNRDADDTVHVKTYVYTSTEDSYANIPVDYTGKVISSRLINQISYHEPRTQYLLKPVTEAVKEDRKILILSDRREHLKTWERLLKASGVPSVDYYVGGRKQEQLDVAATAQVLLGTYSMASEAMNIPALNTIVLSTPKSDVVQSVGRILRQKPDERSHAPLIIECLDISMDTCVSQYRKRKTFYQQCGYKITEWNEEGQIGGIEDIETNEEGGGGKCLLD